MVGRALEEGPSASAFEAGSLPIYECWWLQRWGRGRCPCVTGGACADASGPMRCTTAAHVCMPAGAAGRSPGLHGGRCVVGAVRSFRPARECAVAQARKKPWSQRLQVL